MHYRRIKNLLMTDMFHMLGVVPFDRLVVAVVVVGVAVVVVVLVVVVVVLPFDRHPTPPPPLSCALRPYRGLCRVPNVRSPCDHITIHLICSLSTHYCSLSAYCLVTLHLLCTAGARPRRTRRRSDAPGGHPRCREMQGDTGDAGRYREVKGGARLQAARQVEGDTGRWRELSWLGGNGGGPIPVYVYVVCDALATYAPPPTRRQAAPGQHGAAQAP